VSLCLVSPFTEAVFLLTEDKKLDIFSHAYECSNWCVNRPYLTLNLEIGSLRSHEDNLIRGDACFATTLF
jgi:hypothetical protein